jgi:hypothetical protein
VLLAERWHLLMKIMTREEAEKLCAIQGFIRKKTAQAEKFHILHGKISLVKKCSSGIKTSYQNETQKTEPLVYKDASDSELESAQNSQDSSDEFEVYEPKKRQRVTSAD